MCEYWALKSRFLSNLNLCDKFLYEQAALSTLITPLSSSLCKDIITYTSPTWTKPIYCLITYTRSIPIVGIGWKAYSNIFVHVWRYHFRNRWLRPYDQVLASARWSVLPLRSTCGLRELALYFHYFCTHTKTSQLKSLCLVSQFYNWCNHTYILWLIVGCAICHNSFLLCLSHSKWTRLPLRLTRSMSLLQVMSLGNNLLCVCFVSVCLFVMLAWNFEGLKLLGCSS